MSRRRENVFLTGASSGIGRSIAELLSQKGYFVWGTSRDRKRLEGAPPGFHRIEMRLESPDSIRAAWAETLRQAEHIDVVIQNAGSGIFGAIEDVGLPQAREQWQVLVEGPLQIMQLAAGHMRARRSGVIIGVSSLAAELPLPFAAHYSAGKAALSALLGGLEMELKPFGVQVVDLRPGDIRTSFLDNPTKILTEKSPYFRWANATWRRSVHLMEKAPAPELVADEILRLLQREKTPVVKRIGTFFQARLGPLGPRLLPRRWLLDSIRRYYGLNRFDD